MNQTETENVRRFIENPVMSGCVKGMLLKSFDKKRDGDIYTKGAQTIAREMLEEAWSDMERLKGKAKEEDKNSTPHV